jgi:hypothetical protein
MTTGHSIDNICWNLNFFQAVSQVTNVRFAGSPWMGMDHIYLDSWRYIPWASSTREIIQRSFEIRKNCHLEFYFNFNRNNGPAGFISLDTSTTVMFFFGNGVGVSEKLLCSVNTRKGRGWGVICVNKKMIQAETQS